MKSVLKPTSPSNRSLSRFLQHEATRGITTPYPLPSPGWNASSSHGYPSTFHQASRKIRRYPFAFWVERDTVRVKCLVQEHNTSTRPGIEPRPLDRDSSALTIRSLCPLCLSHCLSSFLEKRKTRPIWVRTFLFLGILIHVHSSICDIWNSNTPRALRC